MHETLLALIAEIYGQLRAATAENARLNEENARLKEENASLKKEA